jgi:GNAT superfamily N-acetyltransferase
MHETALNIDRETKSGVRRFLEDDIPLVADLHRRVFGNANATGSAGAWLSYRRFFEDAFLSVAQNGVASLLHQEDNGAVTGFLGVHPRRLVFEDWPISMAICSHVAVDPTRRGQQIGQRMLMRCLSGPQDLSFIDEGNDSMRRLWERCGGRTALLHSIHWVRPLQRMSAAPLIAQRATPLSAPVTSMAADFLERIASSPLTVTPQGTREELHEQTLATRFTEFTGDRSLRPHYTDALASWIMRRASTRHTGGPLRKVLIRDDDHQIAGWYLFYANRGGIGEVLQIAARKDSIGRVLDHLIDDASQCGVTALSGRLDPVFAGEMSDRGCLFYRRGHWTLIHSRRPELLSAIERGDAFISRLEGEWCLHFR